MQLTPEVLLNAYAQGIFPMASSRHGTEIKWYEPDPRAVLRLDEFHAPKRLLRTYRNLINQTITVGKDFPAVIHACTERDETWLNDELIDLYIQLHRQGHAHSIELWDGKTLAGGLYGVAVPGVPVFCGESMFSRARDASKLCLVELVNYLKSNGFKWLDAQFQTSHLSQFGFAEMRRTDYLNLLLRT
ncbi:MAG TPA: leucyl/phenylalanyl-tRNA--protein transferase [Alphaproteobacteria bacterium]|nr:leucyl/phenylalanyl-tRNA--protein transferase [Rhodospirillaceae bacterium]HRJ11997.1 leucyl/phenylalanyl-tRNA--protein transferase [Alphaproteobacteria bacterium]